MVFVIVLKALTKENDKPSLVKYYVLKLKCFHGGIYKKTPFYAVKGLTAENTTHDLTVSMGDLAK